MGPKSHDICPIARSRPRGCRPGTPACNSGSHVGLAVERHLGGCVAMRAALVGPTHLCMNFWPMPAGRSRRRAVACLPARRERHCTSPFPPRYASRAMHWDRENCREEKSGRKNVRQMIKRECSLLGVELPQQSTAKLLKRTNLFFLARDLGSCSIFQSWSKGMLKATAST